MLWACVVASCTGNISLIDGGIDAMYQQTVEANITVSVKVLKIK